MTRAPDRLYNLLPVIYRLRDYEQGQPLRALLQVIAEQVDHVEDDISQLYENWFIETAQDWAVPYIADLIGYRIAHEAGEPGPADTPAGQRRNSVLIPRREVASTIGYRRRKGTLALLEQLAADVAGWPARAVEFYRLLSWTQHTRFVAPARGQTADLRRGDALDRAGGPFDELAHTVDVRRLGSHRTAGRFSIPAVGLFVWRLKPYPVTRAPAFCIDRVRNHYTFSILGNRTPLLTLPEAEPTPAQIAGELHVPAFIRRRAFEERTPDYYGLAKSLCIWRDTLDGPPVPLAQIVPADLSDWTYRPQGQQVAVDPVLGRIAFAPRMAPRSGVWVSYHYGFSDDLGGGEYPRTLSPAEGRKLYQVGQTDPHLPYQSIKAALAAWAQDRPADAVIEIADSGAYVEQIGIDIDADQRLELRAADGARPTIQLLNFYTNRPDALQINRITTQTSWQHAPRLSFDGLLIAGRSVQINGAFEKIDLRHCTLVPGWSLDQHCRPENEEDPSLELTDTGARVRIERCILGTIAVTENEVDAEPLRLTLADSILDATRPDLDALMSSVGHFAHAALTVVRCTIFGVVRVHALDLGEDSIFDGRVHVARRQRGCLRFCSVPFGSRTPRRYHCQPDLVAAAVAEAAAAELDAAQRALEAAEQQQGEAQRALDAAKTPAAKAKAQLRVKLASAIYEQAKGKLGEAQRAADPAALAAEQQRERERVRPLFMSVRYGTPTYGQLAPHCAPEITRGAADGAEMGVFHNLFQPQREANLLVRLAEYAPADMDAGIFFVT